MSMPSDCAPPSHWKTTWLPSGENEAFENLFEKAVSGTNRTAAKSWDVPVRGSRNHATNASASAKPAMPALQSFQRWDFGASGETAAAELSTELCSRLPVDLATSSPAKARSKPSP